MDVTVTQSAAPLAAAPHGPPPLDVAIMALFADLDGTLAPIEDHPSKVVPDPERTALLARLSAALGGALAVVSGRGLPDLDRVLDASVPAVGALHGLIRRTGAGRLIESAAGGGLDEARRLLHVLIVRHPGLWLEDKGVALALHARAAPHWEEAALAGAAEIATATGLILQPGRMVAELRAPGPDKGDTVAAFMEEAPFAGRTPVFIGDDLTDEHGFSAAERLGGFGVLVGQPRATMARHNLPDVAAAHAWLAAALDRT